MPLQQVTGNEQFYLGPEPSLPEDQKFEDTTISEQWDAALRLENTVFSYVNHVAHGVSALPDPNSTFDPFEHLEPGEDPDQFLNASSFNDMFAIRAKQESEANDRLILGNAGVGGIVLAMGAGVLDPINLIPIGGTAVKTTRAGETILKSAANVGAAGLLTGAATEAILQGTQQSRTTEETVINIAGSTILSGLLGAGAGVLATRTDLVPKFEADMVVPFEGEDLLQPGSVEMGIDELISPVSAVGASVPDNISTLDLSPANSFKFGETLAKLPVFGEGAGIDVGNIDLFNTPDLRILVNSKSRNAKLGMLRLYETPIKLKGNEGGKFVNPIPIQRRVTGWNYARLKAHQFKDQAYLNYRGEQANLFNNLKIKTKDVLGGRGKNVLSKAEFEKEIGLALEKGGMHDIPEVAAAAKRYNELIYKPIGDELQRIGSSPKAPENLKRLAKSFEGDSSRLGRYTNRVYNRDAIRANPKAFVDKIAEYIRQERVEAGVDNIDMDEIQGIAFGVKDRILGLPEGRNTYDQEFDFSGKSVPSDIAGALKHRVLGFDNDFMPEFLITDIEHLADTYTRSVLPDIEMIKETGTADGISIIDGIKDDYNAMINKTKNKEFQIKLQKQMERDIRDTKVLIDRLRHRFGYTPGHQSINSGLSALKSWNIMRLMGGIVPSSLPDVARIGLSEATLPVFKDSINILTKPRVFKLARGEAQMMNTALDIVLEGRAHAFVDIADDLARSTRFGKALKTGTTNFLHATGITKWNEVWETVSANMVQTKIFQASDALTKGRATDKALSQLAEAGIDPAAARVISKQIARHGFNEGSLRFGGYDKWELGQPGVVDAYRKLQAAIQRDVERIIINPGADKPIWLSKPVGSMIGQFKSFGYASLQRSTLLTAQRLRANPFDFATAMTLTSQISLGMAVTYFKLWAAGKLVETTTGWDARRWLREGIDRSGVFGVMADGAAIPMKFMGSSPTRYAQRNITDTLLGPSLGIPQDILSATNLILREDKTTADISAARRLLPFQNYFYFRRLFDESEEALADKLNVSTKRRKSSESKIKR